jgi:uncharacterized protein
MSHESMPDEMDVFWQVDEIEIGATLGLPAGKGPAPAVIFVAGSGPTDRNWNSPLIPGSNGSGALLARALTQAGFVTVRYDKRASGPHALENVAKMTGKVSMQAHIDELAGGVNWLAKRPEVDAGKIFALTNSEGAVHAINYQNQGSEIPLAGLVLTSPPGRAVGALAHSQIAAQLAAVPGGEGMLAAYDVAIADFQAERPVVVDETLPEGLRQMIQAITQPINQPFARELWIWEMAPALARIKAPVLIVLGKKDTQVDWLVDGPILAGVAQEHDNIHIVTLENANHVLKFEPKARAELSVTEVMASYSAEQGFLDPQGLEAILSWLKDQV